MPITKSAKKALRQMRSRRERNIKKKNALKAVIKTYEKLIAGASIDEAKKTLAQVFAALDKAAKTNLIKKNKANRVKSRLAKLVSRK